MKKLLPIFLILSCILVSACEKKDGTTSEINSEDMLSIAILPYDTLNPITTNSESTKQMLNLVFEPLFYCDNNLEVIPILADSYSLDETGLVYTIILKNNVKFSDDYNFSASDVIYSYDLAKSSDNYKMIFDNIKSIERNNNNIQITLKSMHPKFINLLEIPIIRQGTEENAIGTGSFKISEITSKRITLSSTKDSSIKAIDVHILPNESSIFYAFANNELDIYNASSDSPANQSTNNSISKQIPTNSFAFLMLNNQRITNSSFRQAVSYAINRDGLINNIFGGQATSTFTFLNPNWGIYAKNIENYNYNLQNAKNIMKSYSGISSFPIMINNDNEQKITIAEEIIEDMQDAGMNVWLYKVSWEEYQNKIASGDYYAFIGEINLDNSANTKKFFGDNNLGKYYSDDTTATIQSWQSQTTILGQESGFYYIQKAYLKDMPFISLYYENNFVLYSKSLTPTDNISPISSNIYYGIENLKKQK